MTEADSASAQPHLDVSAKGGLAAEPLASSAVDVLVIGGGPAGTTVATAVRVAKKMR